MAVEIYEEIVSYGFQPIYTESTITTPEEIVTMASYQRNLTETFERNDTFSWFFPPSIDDPANINDEVATFLSYLRDTTEVLFNEEIFQYAAQLSNQTEVIFSQEITRFVITSLSQGSTQFVINKVWDTVKGNWTQWATEEIDFGGSYYPGPGAFPGDISHFRVQSLSYTRI